MAQEAIEKKYLAGLKLKSSKKTEGGTANLPTERQLQPADVLDWKDNGTSIIIVAADGTKHTVDKKVAEKVKE